VIHSQNTLSLLGQILRQSGADYIDGKDKIEGWKQKYKELMRERKKSGASNKLRQKLYDLEQKMNEFWSAEEFWFDFDETGETPADAFWEKWALNWAEWDIEYFRRMVKEGKIQMTAPYEERKDVNNKGKEQLEQQRVLRNSGSWERGEFTGGNEGGTFRTGSGDCESIGREATLHAGCVC
jgi:hypothetical protein